MCNTRFTCSRQVFILEELLSPIVTPFILIFVLRNKSLEIIDFFRNFTVEVVGVGDICSFAQMDIRRHGNPTVSSPRASLVCVCLWDGTAQRNRCFGSTIFW